jgi:hypothetical protein
MTSRGLVEEDFLQIGKFLSEALMITAEIEEASGAKLSDFKRVLEKSPPRSLARLKSDVEAFALRFEGIGPIQDATLSISPLGSPTTAWESEERWFRVVPSCVLAAGGLVAAMVLQTTGSYAAAEHVPRMEYGNAERDQL